MWIVASLGAGLLVLLSLLFVPVDLGFRVAREERFRGELRVGWLFGLLRKELEVGRRARREDPGRRRRKRGARRSRGRRGASGLVALVRLRGFPSRCLRLVRRVLRQVKVRELRLRGRVGLDDPADTGLLFAVLSPALCCLGTSPAVSVILEPDFEQASLAGAASGAVRLVPARVLAVLAAFLLSPETLRALRALATARRR